MIKVLVTNEYLNWYRALSGKDKEAVFKLVTLLRMKGVNLDHPFSSQIKGSKLRELRKQSGGRPLRIIYAFDPKRQAVLLVGGDKTGDDRFYKTMVPLAERLWNAHLKTLTDQQS